MRCWCTTKVLARRMLKYYRILWCSRAHFDVFLALLTALARLLASRSACELPAHASLLGGMWSPMHWPLFQPQWWQPSLQQIAAFRLLSPHKCKPHLIYGPGDISHTATLKHFGTNFISSKIGFLGKVLYNSHIRLMLVTKASEWTQARWQ